MRTLRAAWLALVGLLLAAPAAADIDSGLLAHYAMDGDANDSSGHGHHGTASSVSYGTGKFDQAAGFNNTNASITVPSLVNRLPGGNASRTVAFWVYLTDNTSDGNLVSWGNANTHERFSVLYRASQQLALIGQFNDHDSTVNLPLNTWAHVVVTYDGTVIRFYLDGAPGGASVAFLNTAIVQPLRIGVNVNPQSNEKIFGGAIDEIRIYDRELSSADVSQLFSAGPGSAPVPVPASIPTLSEWGMLVMFLMLGGTMLYTLRKQRAA